MDISPASAYDSNGYAAAGAYAGDPGAPVQSDDSVDSVDPSSASTPSLPDDPLVADMQTGIASLEQRFASFTDMLRRELASLESRCAAMLRALFAPSSGSGPSDGSSSGGPAQGNASAPATGRRHGTPAGAGADASSSGAQAQGAGAMQAQTGGPSGPVRYATIIDDAAKRNSLDPALLSAVIDQESGFRADVVSSAGAVGLMQLMPDTARELGVTDPFNPAQNVDGGAKYLRSLLDRYGGRLDLALAAYNAGPAAVDRYGGVPPYAETQAYVAGIMADYRATALRAG